MSEFNITRICRLLQKRKDRIGDTIPLYDESMHVPSRDEVRYNYKLRLEQQRQAQKLRRTARQVQQAARTKASKQKSLLAVPKKRSKVKRVLSEEEEEEEFVGEVASESGDGGSVQVVEPSPKPSGLRQSVLQTCGFC